MNNEKRKASVLIFLIIAGETVFFLPFAMVRIFRPTLLEVFDISNVELGSYFSTYGIVAMISYIFGGTMADRYPARNLMALGLWFTSAGGFAMSFVPPTGVMIFIYGFYGFVTIFLFWAAMIRATREWGGSGFQGRAFGWLEGGRGATAATLGTLSFFLFSWMMPETSELSSEMGKIHPFQYVIFSVSVVTLLTGFLVWRFVPVSKTVTDGESAKETVGKILKLMRMPTIWMLTIIIICAYVGYKITDDFSLYAREVLGFSEVESAGIGTVALWLRALVAISVGIIADKFSKTKVIMLSFSLTIFGSIITAMGIIEHITGLMLLNLLITAIGIYAVRTLYFAVLEEAGITLALTGTAVGIVSFIGFTPDVFMSPLMGFLLDRNPGPVGHQHLFLVLTLFSVAGLITSFLLHSRERR